MRIALHSVSYAGVWPGQVSLPLEQVIRKVRPLGAEGLMLMAKRPHGSVLDLTPKRVAELKALLNAEGVEVACVAGYTDLGAGMDFPDNPYVEKEALYVSELARLAAEFGAGVVRVFTAFERPGYRYAEVHQRVVAGLREAAERASQFGVTLGIQNHHDHAVHHLALRDLLTEIDHPNCGACFDAWSAALHGDDLREAARAMAPVTVFTTVADYQQRRRICYNPSLVSYTEEPGYLQMVPLGEGFIDYQAFLGSLCSSGYEGWVGFEMCAPFVEGGSEQVLDRVARVSLQRLRDLLDHP